MSSKIHLCVGIFVLFVILVCPNQNLFAFQNEPDGFRGIKWGTDIKDLPDMVWKEEDGDIRLYLRKDDKLKIGDAELDAIRYGFYKGRFYGVFIAFKSLSNATVLKETLFQQYGQKQRPKGFMEKYFWFGSLVAISYDYSEVSKSGTILYSYMPIANEERENRKEKARKGASDL